MSYFKRTTLPKALSFNLASGAYLSTNACTISFCASVAEGLNVISKLT